ncbi:MAG: hypothetical protein DCC65_00380 [Planctomycetota bacterium]|nr:MAG: hypothetical protein DCC65_00380 [Planctomycetota bacterium]
MYAARLLWDPPLPGPLNMARDEALLEACHDSDTPAVLRFYSWRPATVSLGYFQEIEDFDRLAPPAGSLSVVRRTTGGGAILHDLEVTYSIILPLSHPLVNNRPNDLYKLAHTAIIQCVGPRARMLGKGTSACDASAHRGPFFCFARRHDLDVVLNDPAGPGGVSKLAGSAQRRTPTAILQHGSIMLASRYPQQPVAAWSDLGGPADYQEAVELLVSAFERTLNLSLNASAWQAGELAAAERLQLRYAGAAWTRSRQR